MRLRQAWKIAVYLLAMVQIAACVGLAQPTSYRVSGKAVEPAMSFLKANACLSMTEDELLVKIQDQIESADSGQRIELLARGGGYFELGTAGRPGLRADFKQGRFIGHSQWIVEMGGSWHGPVRTSFQFMYMPCFFDDANRVSDISFPSSGHSLLQLRGITTLELPSAYTGTHRILNFDGSSGVNYRTGPAIASGTAIRINYKHNEQVYAVKVAGHANSGVMYIPENRSLEDYISFKAGKSVPDFIK